MVVDSQAQAPPVNSDASDFVPPSISHVSNVAYLIGHPIAHSSSPALHDSISTSSQFPYAQVLVESKDLLGFLSYLRNHPSQPRLLGSGVTMPHKVAVIPHLDNLTDEAKAVGAVNTIFFERSHSSDPNAPLVFTGHNTDTIGIRDAFRFNVPSHNLSRCKGRPGLVVGGGGTCRAAIYALQQFLGCSKIYIVNRDASEVEAVLKECRERNAAEHLVHVASVEQTQSLEAPALIVSAVPDFEPRTAEEKTAREILSSFLSRKNEARGALLEMCYHPSPDTQISRLATQAGWQVIGGIEAMIGQGLEQSKLWTGITVDEKQREAARSAVRPKH